MRTGLLFLFLIAFSFGHAQTVVTTVTGSDLGDVLGPPATAQFYGPYGIANNGTSAISEFANNKIKKILNDNSTVLLAGNSLPGFINGTGDAARFFRPAGMAKTTTNDFLVAEVGNHAIRKVTDAGVVTTVAGGTGLSGSTDGNISVARFNQPYGVVENPANGDIYVADTFNHKIRKISGSTVTTFAGDGTQGYIDATGTAARFDTPFGMVFDSSGNLFVLDNKRIRKITPAGVVTTFAGSNTAGYLDGTGTAALFSTFNSGIAIDANNNIYVADANNSRIRKITPAGVVTTHAGSGAAGSIDGNGTVATFNTSTGLAIRVGTTTLDVVDFGSNKIRRVAEGAPSFLPVISAVSSSGITTSGATINYSLSANNLATTSVVKYGTVSGTLPSTVSGFPASGTTTSAGSIPVSGLASNTQYFYRIEATNSAGTTVGPEMSFTTVNSTPLIAFTNLTSSAITSTAATVSVALSNVCAGAQYRLQYATSPSFGAGTQDILYSSGGTNGVKDHNLTGLAPNTLYYFRFYATVNLACNPTVVLSATESFMTTNTQFAFSILTSSAITPITATVSVTLSNVCAGANYHLQYSTSAAFGAGTQDILYSTGGTDGIKNHSLSGLTPSTVYYFRFYAVANQACNPVQIISATESFTTAVAFFAAPTISAISISSITTNSAIVNYTLNANNSGTNSIVRYGLAPGGLISSFTSFTAGGNGDTSDSRTIAPLTPNTQYFYRIDATNSIGTTQSAVGSFTTSAIIIVAPTISAISISSLTTSSARINYTLNANNASTTSIVRYGLAPGALLSSFTSFGATGNVDTSDFRTILPLTPNTQYFYRIDATNSIGTTQSAVGIFTTNAATGLLTEYTFDSTYNNTSGALPFSTIPATTSFVADRNGVPNNALQVLGNSAGTFSNAIAPTGAAARTISLWYRTASAGVVGLFSYGAAAANQTFGAYFGANGNVFFQGFSYDHDFGGSYAANTWRHLVFTFDGTNLILYLNGNSIGTVARPLLNTATGTTFRLGNNTVTISYDDLKVFDYALTASQVTALFTNNSLSAKDFSSNNLKVVLHPNPVKDILNIETAGEIKSVEIYNLLGQKVKTAKSRNINVADLSNGTYMVRVEDTNNAVETMKIVKQ